MQFGRIEDMHCQDSSLIRIAIRGTLLIPLIGGVLPAIVRSAPLPSSPAAPPLNLGGSTLQLERSWERLNQQLDSLDTLLGPAPALDASDDLLTPELPANLMDANRPAEGPLLDDNSRPENPLALPGSASKDTPVQSVSLEQAVAIAFRNNPSLQVQRDRIEAQAARVASLAGTYWPTISVFADAEGFQSGSTTYSPYANNSFGFGPLFAEKGQTPNLALTTSGTSVSAEQDGPFFVPAGGGLYAVTNGVESQAGLELNYAVIDFARTPRVRAAEASLEQFQQQYANHPAAPASPRRIANHSPAHAHSVLHRSLLP